MTRFTFLIVALLIFVSQILKYVRSAHRLGRFAIRLFGFVSLYLLGLSALDLVVHLQHGQLYVALKDETISLWILVHQIKQIDAVHVAPSLNGLTVDVDAVRKLLLQVGEQRGLTASN